MVPAREIQKMPSLPEIRKLVLVLVIQTLFVSTEIQKLIPLTESRKSVRALVIQELVVLLEIEMLATAQPGRVPDAQAQLLDGIMSCMKANTAQMFRRRELPQGF
jgi:hypothetical protein